MESAQRCIHSYMRGALSFNRATVEIDWRPSLEGAESTGLLRGSYFFFFSMAKKHPLWDAGLFLHVLLVLIPVETKVSSLQNLHTSLSIRVVCISTSCTLASFARTSPWKSSTRPRFICVVCISTCCSSLATWRTNSLLFGWGCDLTFQLHFPSNTSSCPRYVSTTVHGDANEHERKETKRDGSNTSAGPRKAGATVGSEEAGVEGGPRGCTGVAGGREIWVFLG